eukprot:SAG22_NODE_680_length_7934_cov_5.365539_1_plen_22_part_10
MTTIRYATILVELVSLGVGLSA